MSKVDLHYWAMQQILGFIPKSWILPGNVPKGFSLGLINEQLIYVKFKSVYFFTLFHFVMGGDVMPAVGGANANTQRKQWCRINLKAPLNTISKINRWTDRVWVDIHIVTTLCIKQNYKATEIWLKVIFTHRVWNVQRLTCVSLFRSHEKSISGLPVKG